MSSMPLREKSPEMSPENGDTSVDSQGHEPEACVRERILAAALGIFADQGYTGASLRQIAGAAKVTKPMVYYYFGSKEGLYQTLLDSSFGAIRTALEHLEASDGSIEDKLTQLMVFHMRAAHDGSDLIRFFLTAFVQGKHPLAQSMAKEVHELQHRFVQNLVQRAADQGLIHCPNIEVVEYMVQGILSHSYELAIKKLPVPKDAESFAKQTITLLFRGLYSQKESTP